MTKGHVERENLHRSFAITSLNWNFGGDFKRVVVALRFLTWTASLGITSSASGWSASISGPPLSKPERTQPSAP